MIEINNSIRLFLLLSNTTVSFKVIQKYRIKLVCLNYDS